MPYEWQSALAGKGIPTILSVCRCQSVCMCLQVSRLWHFTSSSISRGACASTLSSSTGFSCSLVEMKLPTCPPTTIYPIIKPHSKQTVSSGCFDGICLQSKQSEHGMEPETKIGRRRRDGHTHTLECEHRKCNPSLLLLCSPHTWTRPVPTLRQSDTDGANMRDVSSVARERYLLARWKPNAVNYTACLPNHFSPREMAGQDKLVISRKTIHLERWCAVCSQKPPSCSLESDNGREMEQLTGAERWRAHVCRSAEGYTVCVMVTAAPSSPPTPVCLFIS